MDTAIIWSMYYANIVGMQMHPGALRSALPDLYQAAKMADEMLSHYKERYPCQSQPQQ